MLLVRGRFDCESAWIMRGRKPVPNHLKLIRGNPGKRRARQPPEPACSDVPPPPPAHLRGHAAEAWRELAPELWRIGLLSTADVAVFSVYCSAYGRWLDCEDEIAKLDGKLTVTTKNGTRQHPLLLISRQAAETMRRCGETRRTHQRGPQAI